jgi:hypothetical protein
MKRKKKYDKRNGYNVEQAIRKAVAKEERTDHVKSRFAFADQQDQTI